MMITEHNCEEYFLLYTDGELSAAERKAVEDFVLQYPQYAPVLKALQETKLSPEDAVSFPDKGSLYKDEDSDIGINNYEEYFLLYTDNELNKKQKETTERFVLRHPQLQEEFTLLQQTKLAPEVIEYRNKEELYRKERRVLPLYLAGLVAAAVLFAVLFFAGLFTSQAQHSNTYTSLSVTKVNRPAVKPPHKEVKPDNVINQVNTDSQPNTIADKAIKSRSGKSEAVTPVKQINRMNEAQVSPAHQQVQEDIAVITLHGDTRLSQPVASNNNNIAKQAGALKPLDETEDDQTDATTALSLSDNNIMQPAVYKELNTDDDNHTLYVSGIKLNKNKVNGFLKSASRLLGGRVKQSEE